MENWVSEDLAHLHWWVWWLEVGVLDPPNQSSFCMNQGTVTKYVVTRRVCCDQILERTQHTAGDWSFDRGRHTGYRRVYKNCRGMSWLEEDQVS